MSDHTILAAVTRQVNGLVAERDALRATLRQIAAVCAQANASRQEPRAVTLLTALLVAENLAQAAVPPVEAEHGSL